jgi:mannonate dehydratase
MLSKRRDFLKLMLATPVLGSAADEKVRQATRGLPPITIREVKVIPTSAGGRYAWVFVKILTSEPGLYGIGSASNVNQAAAVIDEIEKVLGPFWIGKDPSRIEDLWQTTNVRSYWRNSTIQNNVLSALDMALWDIQGKRAGMPVHDLLGGKLRSAVPVYAHADGRDREQVVDNVHKYMQEGFRHVRAQMGGYGGGGMIAPGQGSRPTGGYDGVAFDEDIYADQIPKLFEYLRAKLGTEVKLLHDVHEHLSPTIAVEFAKRMEPYHMFFVEDILPPEQIDWFRRIKEVCTTPMAMGELFTSPREWLPLIADRTIDFVRCRVSQTGGITQTKKVAVLCEEFGVRTAWQEGGDNDPVNQIAAYHVDMSIPSFGIQEENHFPDLVHEMFPGIGQIKGGYLYGSGQPGLGLDIDEKLALKYPVEALPGKDSWTTVRGMDGSPTKP